MQRVSSGELRSVIGGVTDSKGKHRISAELKRLDQETRFLEGPCWDEVGKMKSCGCVLPEELEELEKMEKASAACKETVISIQTRPDPLLPATIGPINPIWDKWFEGPQDSSGCRCWIL